MPTHAAAVARAASAVLQAMPRRAPKPRKMPRSAPVARERRWRVGSDARSVLLLLPNPHCEAPVHAPSPQIERLPSNSSPGWSHVDTAIPAGPHPLTLRLHRYRRTGAGPELTLDRLGTLLSDPAWLPPVTAHTMRLARLELKRDRGTLWLTNRARVRVAVTVHTLDELRKHAGLPTRGRRTRGNTSARILRKRVGALNNALRSSRGSVRLVWTRDHTQRPVLLEVSRPAPLQPHFARTIARMARAPETRDTVVQVVDVDPTRCLLVLSPADTPDIQRYRRLLSRLSAAPWS